MKKYKVNISETFDGYANISDLRDMLDKGYYTDISGIAPNRIMLIDNVNTDKNALINIINKEEPILKDYQILRKYPSIGDQLDSLYHAGLFPDDMAKLIKEVKDLNPNPEDDE